MLLGGHALISTAEPKLVLSDIVDHVQRSETPTGSFCGRETVSMTRVGVPEPDLSDERIRVAALCDLPEGAYRWYVHSGRWWMVKEIIRTSRLLEAGNELKVIEDYHGRVLAIDAFRDAKGGLWGGSGRLSNRHDQAYLGPMVGRRWFNGPVSGMLRATTSTQLSKSGDDIEIEGVYEGAPIHFTVAPRFGYRVTRMLMHPAGGRFGFSIPEYRKVQGDWMPVVADIENGDAQGERIVRGFTAHVEFEGFEPHGKPTREEAPPIPPGAILGSEENRLYRVAQDGSLVDFGRQGSKPGTPLAYGDLFVLSGAGLLLGSLSWLVFRKRRSSPSSSRR